MPTNDKKKNITKNKENENSVTYAMVLSDILNSFKKEPIENAEKIRNNTIKKFLLESYKKHKISEQYNVLILFDEGSLVRIDADKIYNSITSFTEEKPLLLILYSLGGRIDSAYLIGKLCREYSKDKFSVVVPRSAKSAATIICCAADEIHMGTLSEIGPIDPQIDGLPTLGLKASIEHIAELTKKYPEASDMFAKYLHLSIKPLYLGYFERVAESAVQYAERLLRTHKNNLKKSPEDIAKTLVYSYKDHSFVIDKSEASSIFGDKTIKNNTEEYKFGNSIYKKLSFILDVSKIVDKYFYFIGSVDSEPIFRDK